MEDVVGVSTNLSVDMLLANYRKGWFPMANWGSKAPITWHSPSPRAILPLDAMHISRSLARTLRQHQFTATVDRDFAGVMHACAERGDFHGTWIDERFHAAYGALHRMGHAHSLEVWNGSQLVGGVYGLQIGAAFFAESKFHRARDMSKVALALLVDHLRRCGFQLLEVQYLTSHLAQFGVREVENDAYASLLESAVASTVCFEPVLGEFRHSILSEPV
jgi:leucyl/phenylalanyl-tRNA---protein transferase